MAARRKYTKGRASAQAKSMKMDAAELMTMVTDAVTKALDEREAEKDDDGGSSVESVADIIAEAVESVNEKRKSGDEVSEIPEGDAAELLEAIAEAEEGKSDDDDSSVEDIIQAAADAVNEKRKSRKEDGLNDDDLSDILDAVEEIMSDEEAGGDEKARKSASVKRQSKGRVMGRTQRTINRKYSNIYMTNAPARANAEKRKSRRESCWQGLLNVSTYSEEMIRRGPLFTQKRITVMRTWRENLKRLLSLAPATAGI